MTARALAILGCVLLVGCGSSAADSTALTVGVTLVDAQGAPVPNVRGQVCVGARYHAAYVGGEDYDLTTCAWMTADASGHATATMVLGPHLVTLESSRVSIGSGNCQFMGPVPMLVLSDDDAGQTGRADVTFVVAASGC